MYLLALWPRDCGDDLYTDSTYNRHCDVIIYLPVRAAKLCKRGSMEVHNYHCSKLIQSNFGTIPPRYATLDTGTTPLLIIPNKVQYKLNRE